MPKTLSSWQILRVKSGGAHPGAGRSPPEALGGTRETQVPTVCLACLLGTRKIMSGGTIYEIRVRRVITAPNHYQWVYDCKHPKDNAEYPTVARDAGEAQRAAEQHAEQHPDSQASITVEAKD